MKKPPEEAIKDFSPMVAIDKKARKGLLENGNEITIVALYDANLEPVDDWDDAVTLEVTNDSMGPGFEVSQFFPVSNFPENATHH